MRLIDADHIERDLFDADWMLDNDEHMVEDILRKQPTIDAVPVVHGRWIWDEVGYKHTCSICKCDFDYSDTYGLFDHGFAYAGYCPNCGAKMDGEEDSENEHEV